MSETVRECDCGRMVVLAPDSATPRTLVGACPCGAFLFIIRRDAPAPAPVPAPRVRLAPYHVRGSV